MIINVWQCSFKPAHTILSYKLKYNKINLTISNVDFDMAIQLFLRDLV